jgi:hypothetical protein
MVRRFAACWVLCAAAVHADVLNDPDLIMRLLSTGDLDLSPGVALKLPQEQSQLQIRRVGLRLEGHNIRAAFRDKSRSIPASRKLNVRYLDTYYNEVAAFVVARELGLNMVPPTVLRKIGISQSGLNHAKKLREGSLQLWVENTAVEYEFGDDGRRYPGRQDDKNLQLSEILAFDCIIGNADRHAGNVLIDLNPRYLPGDAAEPLLGKLWAIDHGRAFHRSAGIKHNSCKLRRLAGRPVSRYFMEGMRHWDPDRVETALREAGLSDKQIDSLHLEALDRRLEKMRAHLAQLQQDSGLSDGDFYSSGIWHRVN